MVNRAGEQMVNVYQFRAEKQNQIRVICLHQSRLSYQGEGAQAD